MGVVFTWYGHATIGLDMAGKRILVDPFLTDNPVAAAKAESLAPDYIWVSHGHDDALRAVHLLEPKHVIPVHYNTWELIAQDPHAWERRVRAETRAIPHILSPGEQFTL